VVRGAGAQFDEVRAVAAAGSQSEARGSVALVGRTSGTGTGGSLVPAARWLRSRAARAPVPRLVCRAAAAGTQVIQVIVADLQHAGPLRFRKAAYSGFVVEMRPRLISLTSVRSFGSSARADGE